jgi:protein TonB
LFEQTFIDGPERGVKPWTFAVSIALQCSLLAAAILTPLIFTYELPVAEWLEQTLLIAPPPAPPPQAPQSVRAAPKPPPPGRFDAFVAPASIPDSVALLQDSEQLADGLNAPNLGAMQGGVAGGLEGGVLGAMSGALFVPQMPVRVGGRVQAAKVLSRVSPVYPPEALDQEISGTVHLEAIITTTGLVRDIQVLRGDAILAAAAVEAVQQWRYEPTFLNGRAVEVVTSIDVRFAITAPPEPPEKNERNRNNRRKKR